MDTLDRCELKPVVRLFAKKEIGHYIRHFGLPITERLTLDVELKVCI
jgi:hypothetical protein